MNVLEKLEKIRSRLNNGEDVLLSKQSFTALIQESKLVKGCKEGLCIDFDHNISVVVEFNTTGGALVRILRVFLPQPVNSGTFFDGPTSVV